jgi:hypothetical protein
LIWIAVAVLLVATALYTSGTLHGLGPATEPSPSISTERGLSMNPSQPPVSAPSGRQSARANISAKPIYFGLPATGRLDAADQRDVWSFEGQAGRVVTIRVFSEKGGGLRPFAALAGPDGREVGSACAERGAGEARLQNLTLTASGLQSITVAACEGASSGPYRIELSLKPEATPIYYGSPVAASIDLAGDYQEWKLWAQAGDRISAVLATTGSRPLEAVLSVLDEGGAELASRSGCGADRRETTIDALRLPVSGWYSLRVSGCDKSTGAFQLTLSRAQ